MSLRLPSVLSDHMVLQQAKPINVWGWGTPGGRVEVALAGATGSGNVGADGKWKVTLPARGSGGPFELAISHGGETKILRDVLVGEVWVCSGQSNMEWTVNQSRDASAEIAAARYPAIRMFHVDKNAQPSPHDDCPGRWMLCQPESVGAFSAVGYFFARKLHQELNVPIGMLHTSWGGTTAEAWTSAEALRAEPTLAYLAPKSGDKVEPVVPYTDPGRAPETREYADVSYDDSGWQTMTVPGMWQNTGPDVNGAAWYRRTVDVPAEWTGHDLTLSLGAADDVEDTFFNGTLVGRTTTETPNYWAVKRVYTVPASLVKPGKNVITVRVFDHWGGGGLLGPRADMFLQPVGQSEKPIALDGDWRFKVELGLPRRNPSSGVLPTHLYNGMVQPLLGAGIRGAIWYQGESNADRAAEYRTLLPVMIRDWRKRFAQEDFAFHIVELANWRERVMKPSRSPWAELREAQHHSAKVVGNSAVACTIDIGDALDIHPTNKQDVGLRLALLALQDTYQKPQPASRGPVYAGMKIEGETIRVRFTEIVGGLKSSDPARGVVGFEIHGLGVEPAYASATIDGDEVVVRGPGVKQPIAVRYAWADNPDCTLVNGAGLPAYPFRTDAPE